MVPAVFVTLGELPLTPNGKVDYRALPVPEGRGHVEAELVAPRTETERGVASIWQETLHINEIGVHDNFFELGGHSLLATQVISRLRNAYGLEIPLHVLFRFPTVSELAQHIETILWAAQGTESSVQGELQNRVKGEI
jgi:acyl carrier protein